MRNAGLNLSINLNFNYLLHAHLNCAHYMREHLSAHHCRPNGGCCDFAWKLDYGMEGVWMAARGL